MLAADKWSYHQEQREGEQAMQASYAYGKLPAQNTERVRRFYEEKLGLRPFGERNHHLYYEVGNVRFVIFPSTSTSSGTHDQLGFVVDDLEGTIDELRSKGINFEDYPGLTENSVATFGIMKAAWFKDSEGNLLSLVERPTMLMVPQDEEQEGVRQEQ
jgi:catechol 2,3-dioxygenase-like lactoylglutathione lyase family enzyme